MPLISCLWFTAWINTFYRLPCFIRNPTELQLCPKEVVPDSSGWWCREWAMQMSVWQKHWATHLINPVSKQETPRLSVMPFFHVPAVCYSCTCLISERVSPVHHFCMLSSKGLCEWGIVVLGQTTTWWHVQRSVWNRLLEDGVIKKA